MHLNDLIHPQKRVLDPADRAAEVLCGLIMVMTFTVTLHGAKAGSEEVRTVLIAALGCNTAWGLIDGALNIMGRLTERGDGARRLFAMQKASSPEAAHALIADALPPLVASATTPVELESIRERLMQLPQPPLRPKLAKTDLIAGLGVFLLVFLSTFPVAAPFLVIKDVRAALRISNLIAIILLFFTGYMLGRANAQRPWMTGLFTLTVGVLLAAIALVLGG